MRSTILKIVLVSALVLSLFILMLKAYLEYTHALKHTKKDIVTHPKTSQKTSHREQESVSKTPVAAIVALENETNQTLDRVYKSVASEIEDFLHARKITQSPAHDVNLSLPKPAEKKFVSQCPKPPVSQKAPKQKQNLPQKPITSKPHPKSLFPHTKSLPKVVIIMDDVRSVWQGKMIKKLPIAVTPSIFPVTSDHPETRNVAKMFSCYMVHTPMEAFNYPNEEENTLKTDDTMETIDRRIREIKKDFPTLTAINNHTGSKFTSSKEAMDRLFCVLQKYGIRFVDSRTSAGSAAYDIARMHGQKILSRNVFLDNVDDVGAILARLRETVRYAKKHGIAIAICHPKTQTFEALMRAKKILRGVHVVTLDALYR